MSPFILNLLSAKRGSPRTAIYRGLQWLVMLALVVSLFMTPVQAKASTIPTFSIVSVASDSTVTIQTYNFPAGQIFTVRMGAYGTLGVGGIVVATTNSGAGGSFQETYDIPAELAGSRRIAIRMDGSGGYYAYNWFWNIYTAPTPDGTAIPDTGYSGIPTFKIQDVVEDDTVTIRTNNFPADRNFTVRIGTYGTLGVGGVVVATTNSGAGGVFEETYDIPDSLKGSQRLAIRMDAPGGFFAYNWFWNNTSAGPTPGPIPDTGYTGIPTFKIQSVEADNTVTILTHNFPADLNFTVRMGAYGTLGIGGPVVATTNSGAGGAFTATYDIPDSLKGLQRIAIRMDAPGGYFAYNWFWNNTTGGTSPTPGPIPDTGYHGIPTFKIQSVVGGSSVTVLTNNFPADQNFTVRMGAYGTLGIGGVVVATTNSGAGGAFTATYDIPDSLKGAQRIAIRMESSAGYFAYNWFWNNTAP